MLQTFSIPIVGRVVNAAGRFIRYESAGSEGADASLRVRVDGNDLGLYLPGDDITLPVDATNWELTPVSCTAVVKIGVGSIKTSRMVMQGTIAVQERYARTQLGQQFLGNSTENVNAFTFHFLKAVTKTVVVKRITYSASAATSMYLGICTGGTAIAGGTAAKNKNAPGGAVSQALCGTAALTAAPGGTEVLGWAAMGGGRVAAGMTPDDFKESPLILAPGACLAVYQPNATTSSAVFHFEEL